MTVSMKSHRDISMDLYGDRTNVEGEFMLGAYIVKRDEKWKDPLNGKIYDAVVFKYLSRDNTSPKDIEKIFKERRFAMILHKKDNHCAHISSDPAWHKTLVDPKNPKEIVLLFGDDKHGERIAWDVGCSAYTPIDFSKKEKFYRSEFRLEESSKLSNFLSYIFRMPVKKS